MDNCDVREMVSLVESAERLAEWIMNASLIKNPRKVLLLLHLAQYTIACSASEGGSCFDGVAKEAREIFETVVCPKVAS